MPHRKFADFNLNDILRLRKIKARRELHVWPPIRPEDMVDLLQMARDSSGLDGVVAGLADEDRIVRVVQQKLLRR